jgi:hypothetical protein
VFLLARGAVVTEAEVRHRIEHLATPPAVERAVLRLLEN